jgi:hypothetical protein
MGLVTLALWSGVIDIAEANSHAIGRVVTIGVATMILVGSDGVAAAQDGAHPLFISTIRDPGPAGVPTTARSLALGGAQPMSGAADEASTNAADLMFAEGSDMVASGGFFSFSRDEPQKTPGVLGYLGSSLAPTASSTTPIGYVAIATRRRRWAAAGFYDATSRYDHQFNTADGVLFSSALYGESELETGTGHASISESVTRVGGAAAWAPVPGRLAVGLALYGACISTTPLRPISMPR